MAEIYPGTVTRSLLVQLGYNEALIQDIQSELNTLFKDTGFPEIKSCDGTPNRNRAAEYSY